MNSVKILAMSAILLGGAACASVETPDFEVDSMTAADGKELKITFIQHGSLAINYDGYEIQIDPVGEYADYSQFPKADVILITHGHGDHFDSLAVAAVQKPETVIITNADVAEKLCGAQAMNNGDTLVPVPYLDIRAVAAYNTTEGRTQFHPQGVGNGYVLTLGGTRIYIAGDTENIPEMAELGEIDIAFLPVNQPYTMTPEQAVEALRMFKPRIFYPYHYGMTDTPTDIESLNALLDGSGIELRIRQMQ